VTKKVKQDGFSTRTPHPMAMAEAWKHEGMVQSIAALPFFQRTCTPSGTHLSDTTWFGDPLCVPPPPLPLLLLALQYAVLAPWLAHSVHKFMTGKPEERDMINILVIPSLLMRLLHAQLWITLSRMKTANSKHSIVDKSLDFEQVDRERNWKKEEMVDVVHLTHLTTLQSMYHSRIGLSSLASKPYEHQWYLWIFWPFTHALVQLAWHIGTTFTVERNKLEKLRMETWMMPRYSFQKINGLIEEAILEADKRGAKVLSLGLLNQGDELNGCGMLYVKRNPKLKVCNEFKSLSFENEFVSD
ncbi:hypothetical protein BHE74_00032783, partial [Ensete ventricosum]